MKFSFILVVTLFTWSAVSDPAIPDDPILDRASEKYLAVFEVQGDALVGQSIRDPKARPLGLAAWNRLIKLFPVGYRKEIVQFNIQKGNRWAGMFDGDGKNDVDRQGYRLSIARYLVEKEKDANNPNRPLIPRRGALDWTIVHEMGHYICLRSGAIELFSQAFDGDNNPQPPRREKPDDYPRDGSPVTDGNFVSSYAERNAGDEEVCETFTTYLLTPELPTNNSLVAKKIRFFDSLEGYPELRAHIQSIEKDTDERPNRSHVPKWAR